MGAVITNSQLHRKFFDADLRLIPKVAIPDPTLVTGLPKSVTVDTSMDALTHAIAVPNMTERLREPRCPPLVSGA